MDLAVSLLLYLALTAYLYILPGAALLTWCYPARLSWGEQLGLAAGISVALYPLLFFFAYLAGLAIGPWLAWLPGGLGLAGWLWLHRSDLTRAPKLRLDLRDSATLANLSLGLLLLVLFVSRLLPARDMVAPAWGDSVHHTMIVRLLLDHGGLFQSWAPYAPLTTFTYHFGFHTNAAVWAWVSGMDATQAVITAGQVLNILAVLALYPLAVRLGGSPWAGVGAVLVAGLLSDLPAFYVNWGRYTQLTAQIILPVLVWIWDLWWTAPQRPPRRVLLLAALGMAGLGLTHYRVAVVMAISALAWAIYALWLWRRDLGGWFVRSAWLAGAAMLAGLILLPWVAIVRGSQLTQLSGLLATRSTAAPAVQAELTVWNGLEGYYTPWWWAAAGLALLLALWLRRPLAVPLLIWGMLAFVLANPYLLHLYGTGIITNFLLVIGLYLPLGLLLGWAIGVGCEWLVHRRGGAPLVGIGLAVLVFLGLRQQLRIVDPFYQMVTPNDLAAFAWLDAHTPGESRFLVNGFLAYNNSLIVGADAGWWLPYYTRRQTNIPPILYSVEQLAPGVDRAGLRELALDLQASGGDPAALRALLCRNAITHVYLGDRAGEAGVGAAPLIPAAWLAADPDFTLLYQSGHAQVWTFDPAACAAAQRK